MFPAWLILSALLSQMPSTSPQAVLEKERGDNLFADNQLEAAMRAYDEAIRLSPSFTEALNQRGVTLVRLGRMEEAITSFDQALALDPNYPMALYNKGFALKKIGRHAEVVQAFTRYVQLVPDDAGGFFQLAEGCYVQGDMSAALRAYESFLAMETDPSQGNKIEHSKKRVAELKAKASAASSTPALVQSAKATPSSASAKADMGEPGPNSVLFVTPEREALCNAKIAEGIALRAEGNTREAVFALQDAVQANPKNSKALYELGEAYAAKEYYAQAAARWERVLGMNPSPSLQAQVHDRLTEAYRQMDARGIARDGKPAPATTVVVKGKKEAGESARITSKPLSPPAKEAFLKGTVLFADRDYPGAVHQYDIALVFHPDVSELYSARAAAWLASNDATRALADYTQARRFGPELALPLFGLAESYFALQRNAEALEHYRLFLTSTAVDAKREMIERAERQVQLLQKKNTEPPRLQFGQ